MLSNMAIRRVQYGVYVHICAGYAINSLHDETISTGYLHICRVCMQKYEILFNIHSRF